jgi:hypothetical protein
LAAWATATQSTSASELAQRAEDLIQKNRRLIDLRFLFWIRRWFASVGNFTSPRSWLGLWDSQEQVFGL